MVSADFNIALRSEVGSGPCNRLRNEGMVPGIIYGYNVDNQSIALEKKLIDSFIKQHGENALIGLNIEGSGIQTLIKEIQRDPLTNQIMHIDFQSINLNEPIQATIPVVLKNRGLVENSDAVVQQLLREVTIECLPHDIPESIPVSVKDLAMGNALMISDIEFSNEISVLNDPAEVIASLVRANSKEDEEIEEDSEIIVSTVINSDGTVEEE